MQEKQANNSYAQAAGTYGNHAQKHTANPRELEARVLLKSAKFMQDICADWDNASHEVIEETLKYNRQIWMMFYDTAVENPESDRPDDLRSNIINLANFIFKRELDILAEPKKEQFNVLININREIAAGLMTRPQTEEDESTDAQAASEVQMPNTDKLAEMERIEISDMI